MAQLYLTFLGGFQAHRPGASASTVATRKAQALLAYLAIPPGRGHPRDKLASLLWPDVDDRRARKALRQALFRIRRDSKGTNDWPLRLTGSTVALDPSAVQVDVLEFERCVEQATPESLEMAAVLYRGDLLAGVAVAEAPFEEWLMAERERLRELAIDALAKLLAHQQATGSTEHAVQTALRLLALDPLQESVHRTLMRSFVAMGRRGAALRQYQECIRVLERELGVDPEPETRQLYREILRRHRSDRSLAVQGPASGSGATAKPYPVPDGMHLHGVPPLIGREVELERTREVLERAWSGEAQLLVITGEAGIGKTRLVVELAATAAGRGGRVLVGAAHEGEEILPFGPWVEAFRAGGAVQDAVDLTASDPAWRADLARLFPELPGSPAQAEPDHRRLFESIARLVASLAAQGPLLIVLEDLHWADEMSVRLLAFVRRSLQRAPVLIVTTARDEELVEVPSIRRALDALAGATGVGRLNLSPLTQDTIIRLIGLVGSGRATAAVVARFADRVWTASEGNPFMALETTRALREGVVPDPQGHLPLPERIQDLVGRRLDRLDDGSRRLLAVAAVIGSAFDFRFLVRAAEVGERETAEGLEQLVRRRILHGVGDDFDFTHDWFRQVVYRQLLPARRRLLHLRVAEALQAHHPAHLERQDATLGGQYWNAEAWEQAATYLRRAAAQARARVAHREAAVCYERALAALARLPRTPAFLVQAIDVCLDLRTTLLPLGEFERVHACIRQAESLAAELKDAERLGWIACHAAASWWLTGQLDRAIESGQRALAVATDRDDRALRIAAHVRLGQAYQTAGRYGEAAAALRWNVTAIAPEENGETFGLPFSAAVSSRARLAWCLAETGAFAEALVVGLDGIAIAEALGEQFGLVDVYCAVGHVYCRKGEPQRALTILERGLALCRSRDAPIWLAWLSAGAGYAYTLAGRPVEATPLLEEAVARGNALGVRGRGALWRCWLGETHLLAERSREARRCASDALGLFQETGQRGHEAWAWRLLGDVSARRDLRQARAYYHRALQMAGERGMRPLMAHCHLTLGRLAARASAQRQEHLSTATALYREMEMCEWLAAAQRA